MEKTRWALLGPGAISANFADSLTRSEHGVLHAVGSSNADRAEVFARDHNAKASGTYAQILERDDIDAVYIGAVHTTHAELAIAALRAGKAVLCEKPVTPTVDATAEVLAVAQQTQLPFLEAYKFRFGPLANELRSVLRSGEIGELRRLSASVGFAAAERSGRLFDPALAGGAILDVGGYPVSLAVGFAAWAGQSMPAPVAVSAVTGEVGQEGVDTWASATMTLGSLEATVHTSIVSELSAVTRLEGSGGWIDLPDVWGGRADSATSATVYVTGQAPRRIEVAAVDPMAAEADAISLAIADGRAEIPEMTWAETTTIAAALADWRSGLA
jgi:predicted dehydrogenase